MKHRRADAVELRLRDSTLSRTCIGILYDKEAVIPRL